MPSTDKSSEMEKMEKQSYVKNSSFLSRDIEARKTEPVYNTLKKVKQDGPKKELTSPPLTSPPISTFKITKSNSKEDSDSPKQSKESIPKEFKVEPILQIAKEVTKPEPNQTAAKESEKLNTNVSKSNKIEVETNGGKDVEKPQNRNDESNGVGDKIKKFEKVAEEATVPGRLSRASSVRGRGGKERHGSDTDLPPPPTVPLEPEKARSPPKQNCFEKQPPKTPQNAAKWQRSVDFPNTEEKVLKKPEPQKIIKPEFSKPVQQALDVTIRSPSLGTKISDQFPSHGTAFRNVVGSPDATRNTEHVTTRNNDENNVNTQNNFKPCKLKGKEDGRKYSVSKGSSYYTRGSEEIWLVKKKDIEEIEARVLDSFTRAGGSVCSGRNETVRPSSDSGQGVSFSHTMGRNKRQMYTRSESLDPQWAGARSQTLKRQTSVACTCGHDKKPRAKSSCDAAPPRPRSRSHGDDNSQAHVLDKYETLV